MRSFFRFTIVATSLLLSVGALPGCSTHEGEGGKMDSGAMEKGKMDSGSMEKGKMDSGAMEKGSMK
ncbi:MAG: hypothetical protein ACLP7Q_13870 [Isosphaeraceae bacterium]